ARQPSRAESCQGPVSDEATTVAENLLKRPSSQQRMPARVLEDTNVGMLLSAFSSARDPSRAWMLLGSALSVGIRIDGQSLGCLMLQALPHQQAALLATHLPAASGCSRRDGFQVAATTAAAMLLASSGDSSSALSLLEPLVSEGLLDLGARRLWLACGGPEKEMGPIPVNGSSWDVRPGTPYAKEMRLLQYVLSNASPGDPASVCEVLKMKLL
ncbi:unnamed protein product, partial [Polarella glacialis]